MLYYISHINIGIVTHSHSSYARLFSRRSRLNSRLHVCPGAEYRISILILEISRRNLLFVERSCNWLFFPKNQWGIHLSGGIHSRFDRSPDITVHACYICHFVLESACALCYARLVSPPHAVNPFSHMRSYNSYLDNFALFFKRDLFQAKTLHTNILKSVWTTNPSQQNLSAVC